MNIAIRMMVLGPVQTNCFFLINEDTKEVLIIDPADRAQRIIEWINSEHLKPVAILLTHGHFDHIGGLAYYVSKFNNAVVSMHKRDVDAILSEHDVFYVDIDNKDFGIPYANTTTK